MCTYLFANQLQGLCFLLKVAFTGGQVLFHWHIATGKRYLILNHSCIGVCMLHNNLFMLWSHVLPCYRDQNCQLLHVLLGHGHSVFIVKSTLHFGHGSSSATIAELRSGINYRINVNVTLLNLQINNDHWPDIFTSWVFLVGSKLHPQGSDHFILPPALTLMHSKSM